MLTRLYAFLSFPCISTIFVPQLYHGHSVTRFEGRDLKYPYFPLFPLKSFRPGPSHAGDCKIQKTVEYAYINTHSGSTSIGTRDRPGGEHQRQNRALLHSLRQATSS